VDKLNEGWDVLNLFDIVRLYEGQNTGGSNKAVILEDLNKITGLMFN
jgi:type III restriction enzyme